MNFDLVCEVVGVLIDPWGDFQSGSYSALIVSNHNCVISFMFICLVILVYQEVSSNVVLKARVILLQVAAGVTDCGHVFVLLKTVLKACLLLVHVHCHVFLDWFLAEVRNHQAHLEVLLRPHPCRVVQFLF